LQLFSHPGHAIIFSLGLSNPKVDLACVGHNVRYIIVIKYGVDKILSYVMNTLLNPVVELDAVKQTTSSHHHC